MGFHGGLGAAALAELILKSMELQEKLKCAGCDSCDCAAPSAPTVKTVYHSPITTNDRLFVGAMAFVAGYEAEAIAKSLHRAGLLPVGEKARA